MPIDPVNGLLDQLTQKLNIQPHQDAVSMGLGDMLRNLFTARRSSIELPNESGKVDRTIARRDPAQALRLALKGK